MNPFDVRNTGVGEERCFLIPPSILWIFCFCSSHVIENELSLGLGY